MRMKECLVVTVMLFQLFNVALYAQRRAAGSQAAPRQMQYEKLADYVDDYNARHNGEHLIVSHVPMVKDVSRISASLYDLKVNEEGGVGANFVTSAVLVNSLRPHLKSDTTFLRVSCTLVEFAGEFDVYRTSFATKIEGLDEHGELSWTAAGPEPARLKYKQ
jgi:hypothetical protein